MNQPYRTAIFALGTVALLALTSCATNAASTNLPPSSSVTPAANSANSAQDRTIIAQAAGDLLSKAQKAELAQLGIPIVLPAYLPPGFRVKQFHADKGEYANGDNDSGYLISYQGANNSCITLYSSQDGPRGQRQKLVQTRFGSVGIYTQKRNGKTFIYSFIPIAGNPSLTSGGSLPDTAGMGTDGGGKSCNAVSMEEYVQVLKSLKVMK